MPRVFFHGQLACFDSAVTTMWLLVVYAYFRSLEQARWGVIAGVLFGLALATKHNAWFIPALLLIHYLMVVWPDLSLRPLPLPRIPLVFICHGDPGPAGVLRPLALAVVRHGPAPARATSPSTCTTPTTTSSTWGRTGACRRCPSPIPS